jgi:hypothetical protein
MGISRNGYFAKYEIGRNFRGISAEFRKILGDRHLPFLLVLAGVGAGGGLIHSYLHPLLPHWGWVTATCLACWYWQGVD